MLGHNAIILILCFFIYGSVKRLLCVTPILHWSAQKVVMRTQNTCWNEHLTLGANMHNYFVQACCIVVCSFSYTSQLAPSFFLLPNCYIFRTLINLTKHPFGNYVLQRILESVDVGNQRLLLSRLYPHLGTLKKYSYARYVIGKMEMHKLLTPYIWNKNEQTFNPQLKPCFHQSLFPPSSAHCWYPGHHVFIIYHNVHHPAAVKPFITFVQETKCRENMSDGMICVCVSLWSEKVLWDVCLSPGHKKYNLEPSTA